ncbi:MAG TPA: hypothetical protein VF503_22070 [Sphingobium sp.]|uniref:hypothetical protein n=1 Tax=Sphingobium sp. TaxID=1912891 RepID=UPI002ED51F1B
MRGDITGLVIPAHPDAFAAAGETFLTTAFHAFGMLPADNAVTRIVAIEPCDGGSTGKKMFLTVEYAKPAPGLRTDLFVKFSRDLDDERRDLQRDEMQSEAAFTWVSHAPGFPIHVPRGYFADYHADSGTGIVITERIAFGSSSIQPHRPKTMDHRTMDNPISFYRAIIQALGKLAGTHKAGRLASMVGERLSFDPMTGSADPIAHDAMALEALLDHVRDFTRHHPQLLPEELRTPEFLESLARGARHIRANEKSLRSALLPSLDYVALCHWNAHVDNCWFWTEEDGELACGFLDWGRVGQITFGSAIWGALCAAHHDVWDTHLDDLLTLFSDEVLASGGPAIRPDQLYRHLMLHIAVMGIARVLSLLPYVMIRLPAAAKASGPLDPMFEQNERARSSLHVYTIFAKLWKRHELERLVCRIS